jgi:hypothetical protein
MSPALTLRRPFRVSAHLSTHASSRRAGRRRRIRLLLIRVLGRNELQIQRDDRWTPTVFAWRDRNTKVQRPIPIVSASQTIAARWYVLEEIHPAGGKQRVILSAFDGRPSPAFRGRPGWRGGQFQCAAAPCPAIDPCDAATKADAFTKNNGRGSRIGHQRAACELTWMRNSGSTTRCASSSSATSTGKVTV